MSDIISRKAAIEAISYSEIAFYPGDNEGDCLRRDSDIKQAIMALPSAEPEIVRCKDCKYRDENWRRVSVRWLPCMDVRTGSNWYCGSAERSSDG